MKKKAAAAVLLVTALALLLLNMEKIHCEMLERLISMGKDTDRESSIESINAGKGHNYVIFIEIEDKRLYVLEGNKAVKTYPIATGKSNFPSPIGSWNIVSKGSWGGGFGERWLGLNVPWGKYGIHGTNRPGSIGGSASHGCIRMYNKDIRELYGMVSYGTRVIIVNGRFGPFGTGFKLILPGARGADVYAVQKRLKELGYYTGFVDGIYGENMKTAVHSFQRANGLPVKNEVSREDLLKMGFREFD